MTGAWGANPTESVLASILHDAGHEMTDASVCWPPRLIHDAASGGPARVVCGCGFFVEPPGTPEPVAADPVQPGLPLIDPSQITTPDELNAHLLDVIARLESGQLFERQCIEDEYAAKLAWELAKAEQVAKGGGAEDVRTARALTEQGDLYRKAQLAEMMRKACQAAMHNLRSVLSGYQSVSKSVLSTYGAGGSPGPANQRGRY